jgi:hypothetical protein
MTFGTLAVEILPLKKGNIVLTSHPPLYLPLARAGEEEGEGWCQISKLCYLLMKHCLKFTKNGSSFWLDCIEYFLKLLVKWHLLNFTENSF